MIYITGDTHAEFNRFNITNFPEQKEMTKDDYVIICGDFGGIWDTPEESGTVREWHGGKVHEIRPSEHKCK